MLTFLTSKWTKSLDACRCRKLWTLQDSFLYWLITDFERLYGLQGQRSFVGKFIIFGGAFVSDSLVYSFIFGFSEVLDSVWWLEKTLLGVVTR